jgi:hypothetical protein
VVAKRESNQINDSHKPLLGRAIAGHKTAVWRAGVKARCVFKKLSKTYGGRRRNTAVFLRNF